MNNLAQEARALCEGATEGPWEYDGMHHEIQCFHGDKFWLVLSELREHPGDKLPTDEFGHVFNADFALIARARTLLPEMAEEIERLEGKLATLTADIEAGRLIPAATCTWTEDSDGIWRCSDCEINWYFDSISNSPADNECYFCPRCGRKIETAQRWESLAAMKEDAHG